MQKQTYESDTLTIINETSPIPRFQELVARTQRLLQILGESHAELCVMLLDDESVRELNAQWRGIDETTDVLSFPMRADEDEDIAAQLPLGDIAISLEVAARQTHGAEHQQRLKEAGAMGLDDWSLVDEVFFLIVHGCLHLLGYDHIDEATEREMRAAEAALFQQAVREVALKGD